MNARVIVAAAIALTCLSTVQAEGTATHIFRVAYLADAFKGISKPDAIAAMTTWAETMIQKRNLPAKVEVEILPNLEAALQGIRTSRLDMLGLPILDYLIAIETTALDPCFLGSRQNSIYDTFVLLVHAQGPYQNVYDLAGQDILYQTLGAMNGGRLWLELMLTDHQVEPAAVRVREVNKPADAVLPVFFKRTPAGVATRQSFDAMVELNPQVGRDLKVLRESPPVAQGVIVMRPGYQTYRREVLEELAIMDQTPRGRQILTLLRFDGVRPFDPAALESVRDLRNRHARIHALPSASPRMEAGP